MRITLLLIALLGFVGSALAGQDEIDAARGAGFALVIVEKCTGVPPPSSYVQRLRSGMLRAGMDDQDFQEGFAAGAMQAEMQYRGKPPANECKDAKRLKTHIDKAFL